MGFRTPFKSSKRQYNIVQVSKPVVTRIEFKGLVWLDIERPTANEINMLKENYDFHDLLLEDCMTEHQRSKIDNDDDYSFIVLHLPRYRKNLLRLDSEELDIFIGPDYLVTLHEGELKPLVELTQLCASQEAYREKYMSKGSALLLYEMLKVLLDYCFPMLDKIGQRVADINRFVFYNRSKEMLENISRVKMEVINYRSIMKPLRFVMMTLEKVITRYLPDDMDIYYDDITDRTEKIWDMLENYKEVIEAADGTFASLTNHTINNLMRTFTIIQVTILPMTLVSGLFSMNVLGIPMHAYQNAFWIVFGMIFIPTTILGIMLFIKKNKWF
jgi:magnesium transporter